ncbi:protein C-ets-1-like isoform X2 [Ptychodera flava]|uniref:protein C-ets-1-like isoform X2 n=1 Tax=Ptychodera flava TaxID=63121 RepID=UPI00396A59B5
MDKAQLQCRIRWIWAATMSCTTNTTEAATASQGVSRPNEFPRDPRDWTRDHVIYWLLWATSHYKIEPVEVERFHMNGIGLTYLNREGFLRRAPSGGEQLFEDFQRRFAHAIMQGRNAKDV